MSLFIRKIGVIYLFATAMVSLAGNAQEVQLPPISTERPTVGNSPDLIPGGSIQFKNCAGVSFQKVHWVGDVPETFVRLGLSDHVGVRYLASDEVYQRSHSPRVASFQS